MNGDYSASWAVGATTGVEEVLKDQGLRRWNYPSRSLQARAWSIVVSMIHPLDDRRSSCAAIDGSLGGVDKRGLVEESMEKVMYLSCWGPNTVRF